MRRIEPFYIIILLLMFLQNFVVRAQYYNWSKSIGGKAGDGGGTVLTDNLGYVYTLGFFNDTVDFDPGPGIAQRISTNLYGDTYVLKQDSLGNFISVKTFGGPAGVLFTAHLVRDASKNFYISGIFNGPIDFDPGPATVNLPSQGAGYHLFFMKWDSLGNYLWGKSIGDFGCSILNGGFSIDAFSNIYVNSYYTASPNSPLDVDPGPGVKNLTDEGAVTIKFDASGNFIWGSTFSWPVNQSMGAYGTSVFSDNFGNVFSVGYFNGTIDFDPGPGVLNIVSAGQEDIFITKLDNSGNLLWVKTIGGISPDLALDFKYDGSSAIYVTGVFGGSVDFDPGPNVNMQNAVGDLDVFVSKFSTSSNLIWCKSFGDLSQDYCNVITLDKNKNVYTAGGFSLSPDFDPGPNVNTLSCTGWWDGFILKLDSTGNYVWAKSLNGLDTTTFSFPQGIAIDKDNNLYASGQYYSSADFNPDWGKAIMKPVGDRESFILKLGRCNVPLNLSPAVNICLGKGKPLTINGPASYTWYPGGLATSTLFLNPNVTTIYTVVGGFDNICQKSQTMTVNVFANPVSVITTSNSICTESCNGYINALTSNGSPPYTFSLSNNLVPAIPYYSLCNGNYTLYTIDANGCVATNSFSIECINITGLDSKSVELNNFRLFPNPTSDILNLKGNLAGEGKYQIIIQNNLGQVIRQEELTFNENTTTVNINGLPNGVYIVSLKGDYSNTLSKRFVVSR